MEEDKICGDCLYFIEGECEERYEGIKAYAEDVACDEFCEKDDGLWKEDN